jgi:hypothetical protein
MADGNERDMLRILRNASPRLSGRLIVALVAVAALVSSGAVIAHGAFVRAGVSPTAKLDQATPAIDDRPAYDWAARPLADSIVVTGLADANKLLPFEAVLPASARPVRIFLSDPARTPRGSIEMAATFDDPHYGVFQLFEQPVGISESALEAWATNCNTCSLQEVATVGSAHVLILSSPGHGISFTWLKGGVLRTIMGPEQSFTRSDGLALVSDIVSRGVGSPSR